MGTNKSRIMQISLFLAILFSQLAAAGPTINAQLNTSCDLTDCITSVDMSKYLTSPALTTVKAVDLKSFLSSLKTASLSSLNYSWSGSILNIYGTIAPGSSNYWVLNVSGAAEIDPWFNSSFPYCKNITMTDNAVKAASYTFLFNITNFTGMNPDASDLRFVNDSCNGAANAIELPHWDMRIVNNSMDEAYVLLQNTTRNISIYYGNPTAADTSDITTAGLFGDNFNRGDGAVNNDWTTYNSCGAISSNQLRITGTTWFCGVDRAVTGQSSNEGQEHIFTWWENTIGDVGIRWDIGGKTSQYLGGVPMVTFMFHSTGGSGFQYYNASVFTPIVGASTSTWYQLRVQVNKTSSKSKLFINGTAYTIIGANQPFTTFNASFGAADAGATSYIDNFFSRKYNYNESQISYSIGAQQINIVGSPLWSIPINTTPAAYSPSTASVFNITWANGSATSAVNTSAVNLTVFNSGTNIYTMSCAGTTLSANCSYSLILGAGNYTWQSTAKSNDSSPVSNTSSNFTFNITKASPSCSVSFTTPITYNATHTPVCSCNNSDTGATIKLWRNGTDVSSQNNTALILGAGSYGYICNSSSSQNYTAATASSDLVIAKGTLSLDIVFNPVSPVIAGTAVNISCNSTTAQVPNPSLYNDTAALSNPLINFDTGSLLGAYNFTCNNSATANYSAGTTTEQLAVSSASGLVINVYNEENTSQGLQFNLTINNGTAASTTYNQNNPYVNNSISGLITIDISGSSWPQREYYTAISSGSVSINGYLLDAAAGSWCSYYVYSPYDQPIPSALINVERLIPPSSYITIAQKKTDTSGSAVIFLSPITTYRFNISAVNYENKSILLQPGSCPYVIYINSSSTISYNSTFRGLYWQISPEGSGLLNETTAFNFTISASDSDLNFWGLNITLGNGTALYFQNSTAAAGGSFQTSINLGPYNGSTIRLYGFFKKAGWPIYTFQRTYYIYTGVIPSNSSLVGMAQFLNGKMDPFTWGVLSLFINLIVMGAASSRLSSGGSGVLGLLSMVIMTYLGIQIFGIGYWLGFNMIFGIGLAVLGMLYLRSNV